MHQELRKTLTEAVLSTAEPEPSTSISTDPSRSSPLSHKNAQAACHCLYEINDGKWHGANHGGDRAALLITEVCSPMPTP